MDNSTCSSHADEIETLQIIQSEQQHESQEGADSNELDVKYKLFDGEEYHTGAYWKIINSVLKDYPSSDEESPQNGETLVTFPEDEYKSNVQVVDWEEKQKGDFMVTEICTYGNDDKEQEAGESWLMESVVLPPSGLTTAGPMKNIQGNSLDLRRHIDYGKMKEVHKIDTINKIDLCCKKALEENKDEDAASHNSAKNEIRGSFLRQKAAATLPPEWKSINSMNTINRSALAVLRRGRAFFRTTASCFRPQQEESVYYSCTKASQSDTYSELSIVVQDSAQTTKPEILENPPPADCSEGTLDVTNKRNKKKISLSGLRKIKIKRGMSSQR